MPAFVYKPRGAAAGGPLDEGVTSTSNMYPSLEPKPEVAPTYAPRGHAIPPAADEADDGGSLTTAWRPDGADYPTLSAAAAAPSEEPPAGRALVYAPRGHAMPPHDDTASVTSAEEVVAEVVVLQDASRRSPLASMASVARGCLSRVLRRRARRRGAAE